MSFASFFGRSRQSDSGALPSNATPHGSTQRETQQLQAQISRLRQELADSDEREHVRQSYVKDLHGRLHGTNNRVRYLDENMKALHVEMDAILELAGADAAVQNALHRPVINALRDQNQVPLPQEDSSPTMASSADTSDPSPSPPPTKSKKRKYTSPGPQSAPVEPPPSLRKRGSGRPKVVAKESVRIDEERNEVFEPDYERQPLGELDPNNIAVGPRPSKTSQPKDGAAAALQKRAQGHHEGDSYGQHASQAAPAPAMSGGNPDADLRRGKRQKKPTKRFDQGKAATSP